MKFQGLAVCKVCSPCYKQACQTLLSHPSGTASPLWPLTLDLDVDGLRHDLFIIYLRLTNVRPVVWTLHAGYARGNTGRHLRWAHFEPPLQTQHPQLLSYAVMVNLMCR